MGPCFWWKGTGKSGFLIFALPVSPAHIEIRIDPDLPLREVRRLRRGRRGESYPSKKPAFHLGVQVFLPVFTRLNIG